MSAVYDVVILGAGPAGLTAAAAASRRGLSVLLLDKNVGPGKKLLLTGGGKANVTNRSVSPADYVGENPAFTRAALQRFTPEMMLRRLADEGINVEEREYGRIFCKNSARAVLEMLLRNAGKCRLVGENAVERIEAGPEGFALFSAAAAYRGRKLILATGSPAWPSCGADDSGLLLAHALGHRIVPVRPVLAPLLLPPDSPLSGLAGISAEVAISCDVPDSPSFTMPLLFTHNGISGPAILQISCWWRKGSSVILDFLPGLNAARLIDGATGKSTPHSLFSRLLPDRLCRALLPPSSADRRIAELSRRDRDILAAGLTAHRVTPLRSAGLHKAEAAAGGVDTGEVNALTMESLRVPGLFFCGEALDVAGRLGGYNLHWAWASGELAGSRA